MELTWLKVEEWEKNGGPHHGFLGRQGGRSAGTYAGLNVSYEVGDDPAVVKDNFCDLKKAVGLHERSIVTMKQVHGDRVIDVKDKQTKNAGEADGIVTNQPGVFLGVMTADCVPLLFSCAERKVAAAVHAGWRGTAAGIAQITLRHLRDRYAIGPLEVSVALGPAIGPCCYEIRGDVSIPLVAKWGTLAERCLDSRDGSEYLDLRRLNRLQLEISGVSAGRIFDVGPCTRCSPNEFFSYRGQRGKTGHQMSFIGWPA
jgi:hypothetical protein